MHINIHPIVFLCVATFTLSVIPQAFAADTKPINTVTAAKVTLMPTKDNVASGVVTFTQVSDGIKIVADISGLTPGEHGFHVHEFGDCGVDGMSAGGHFNPSHALHGAPDAPQHHAGDFGNVMADASGKAHYEFIDHSISFAGQNSILGRGMIVHEKQDDLHSQPVGNAGARLACGVIGVAKP